MANTKSSKDEYLEVINKNGLDLFSYNVVKEFIHGEFVYNIFLKDKTLKRNLGLVAVCSNEIVANYLAHLLRTDVPEYIPPVPKLKAKTKEKKK